MAQTSTILEQLMMFQRPRVVYTSAGVTKSYRTVLLIHYVNAEVREERIVFRVSGTCVPRKTATRLIVQVRPVKARATADSRHGGQASHGQCAAGSE